MFWALTFAFAAPGFATTYYVSSSGSDSNPGTQSAPFLTIQHAANIVNPGDTVIVENGTYTNPGGTVPGCCAGANLIYLNRGGTAANWVTFQSANLWGAVIDGVNNTTGDCWNFGPNADYIRIQGFEVKGCSGTGFDNYGGGQNLDIVGNHIHDIGRYCSDSGIGFDGIFLSNNNVTVEQNIIHDIGRYQPGENGCNPKTTTYESNDHGVYISGASNITVRNNIFYHNIHGYSVTVYNPSQGSSNLAVLNNTFAFPSPWDWGHICMCAPVQNSEFANNIFYEPNSYGVYFWNTSGYSNVAFSNNITYRGTIAATYNGAVQENPSSVTGVTFTSNQDKTDPKLLSPSTFDFYLTPGSPALDAGLQLSQVPNDFCGITRPQGAYDIGAFESSLGPCPNFPTIISLLPSVAQVTVSVSSPDGNGTPTGTVSLAVDGGAPVSQALASGSAIFSLAGVSAGAQVLHANYASQNGFEASSESTTVTVTSVPSFALAASPNAVTIVQGSYGTSNISITPSNGFNGSVSLSASGLPSGVTAGFNPNPATSASTLSLTASTTAPTGTATINVTGTSGSLTGKTTLSLTIATRASGIPASGVCNGTYNQSYNGNVTVPSGATCTLLNAGIGGNITVQGNGTLTCSNEAVYGTITLSGPGGTLSFTGGSIESQGNNFSVIATSPAAVNLYSTSTAYTVEVNGSGGATPQGLDIEGTHIYGSVVTNGAHSVLLVNNSIIEQNAEFFATTSVPNHFTTSMRNTLCNVTIGGTLEVENNTAAFGIGDGNGCGAPPPSPQLSVHVDGSVVVTGNQPATTPSTPSSGSVTIDKNYINNVLSCSGNTPAPTESTPKSNIIGSGGTGQCTGFGK